MRPTTRRRRALLLGAGQASSAIAFSPPPRDILMLGTGWIQDAPVKRIEAGTWTSIAIRVDGTLAELNLVGKSTYPEGFLDDVSNIAAGSNHLAVLKSDGTVQTYGWQPHQSIPGPKGLADVVALDAGGDHTDALRKDGTVVSWGISEYMGVLSVPVGLSGVRKIASGEKHTVAFRNDGSVVAWGDTTYGQTSIPPGIKARDIFAGGNRTWILLDTALSGSVRTAAIR